MKIWTQLAITMVCIINAINCGNLADEQSARHLLMQANEVYWNSATGYGLYADDTFSPDILMREKLRNFHSKMEKYDWKQFKDPMLRRQFQIILNGAKYPPIDYAFKKATTSLKTMSRQKWSCRYNDQNHCDMAFIHQIKTIFAQSDDLDELKYYWKEWRDKIPENVKEALHYYVNYYQNITVEGLPSAAWYDSFEDPHFMDELSFLMAAIRPIYRELHAHVRHLLSNKYGEHIVSPSGLIPHHLMEQITYQAWKKESLLGMPFPNRKLPNMQSELDNVGLYPFDLVNISAQFFGSIGMHNLSQEFMHDHIVEMESGTGGPDCKSKIYDYAQIEMHYCPKVYFKKLLQTHGDMAHVQYALLKNNLRVGLNQEACPGFANALGEAVILSASTPKYLQQKLGLLQDYDYDDILNLNRLYRQGVHTLLTLPTYFVHEKLWVDMIDGKIQPNEYNCHYWSLMEHYMGVEAPVERTNANYDFPYKFYEGIIDQTRHTKKLVGEFLGYQMYRSICMSIGEYEIGNAYKPLINCDFANKKRAGKLISDMMSAGSMKPWRELIKPLTIRQLPQISPMAFLEYFEPLHNWLAEDNYKKNLHIGWNRSTKCKSKAADYSNI